MSSIRRALRLLALLFLCTAAPSFAANDAPADEVEPRGITGPASIRLLNQATLKLPAGLVYFGREDAERLLISWGNPGPHDVLGLVLSEHDEESWAVSLNFLPEGYVKDEDAKNWNADELFKSVQEGTEASNEERKRIGGGELHVVSWAQKPQYDAARHHLAWGILADSVHEGETSKTVNYQTYVLGREGYIEMTLMTSPNHLAVAQPRAESLLAATHFETGKRYEDFSEATDKVAAYGLAALVAGGVAKKAGLLAAIGLLFAKFWKLLLIGLVVCGGAVTKLFKRKAT